MSFSGTQQKCKVCEKTVYPMDQLSVDGTAYHRSCFRCSHCRSTLQIHNYYHSSDGTLYCKQHFEQLRSKSLHQSQDAESAAAEPVDNADSSEGVEHAPEDEKPEESDHPAEDAAPPELVEEAMPPVKQAEEDVKSPANTAVSPKSPEPKKTPAKTTMNRATPDSAKTCSRTAGLFQGTQDKCATCGKTAYPLEKVMVEGQNYHKSCFRCAHGGCALSPSNYAALEGILYCKPHFAQLFKEKGSYNHIKIAASKHAEAMAVSESEPSS